MPNYQHHFMPLHPAPSSEDELRDLEILGGIDYPVTVDIVIRVSFIGTPNGGVRVIAATLPEADSDHPDRSLWFKKIFEGAIAAIRLCYDADAGPIHAAQGFLMAMVTTEDAEPSFPLILNSQHNSDWRVDAANLVGVFADISKPDTLDVVMLMAESNVASLPPHYGVLSLLRAIELLWPDERARALVLDRREAEFAALGISQRPFRSALPEIRNQCAHGQGRGRRAPQPFAGIGFNNPGLQSLRGLLTDIVIDELVANHGLNIARVFPDAEA